MGFGILAFGWGLWPCFLDLKCKWLVNLIVYSAPREMIALYLTARLGAFAPKGKVKSYVRTCVCVLLTSVTRVFLYSLLSYTHPS